MDKYAKIFKIDGGYHAVIYRCYGLRNKVNKDYALYMTKVYKTEEQALMAYLNKDYSVNGR